MDATKAQEALRIARELAEKSKSSVDFHNLFFGVGGKFSELFPGRDEREEFAKTQEYRDILQLRSSLAQPKKVAS